ncbi:MAG: hypothetical protein OXE99_06095 [Cellvibrionales bacterium]|nr:hypothetical protein [Cellvibrionales bacterium]
MSAAKNGMTSPVERVVSALTWLKLNYFRRVYYVSYMSEWKYSAVKYANAEINISGTWGNNLINISEFLAKNNPSIKCGSVTIKYAQKIGFKIFGKTFYTW